MKCEYVEPIRSETLIKEFEDCVNYTFPQSFKDFIIHNNGGYPDEDCFMTKSGVEHVIGNFCSFNHDDSGDIWLHTEWHSEEWANVEELACINFDNYVVFAEDPFGAYIAFEKSSNKVVFICFDYRPSEPVVDYIADSFEEFIEKCYVSEDDEDDDE